LAFLLVCLGERLSSMAEDRLPAVGLDEREYTVLAILAVDGPGSQHEIARLLGKAPGVVVALVDQLESKGFVERQRDPADRRRSRVTPTATGQRALEQADGLGEDLVTEALVGLDAGERSSLLGLLRKGLVLDAADRMREPTRN
jgi:MarR family transcriptional regulator, lower aerobic nicotinate degradation pathway regulator